MRHLSLACERESKAVLPQSVVGEDPEANSTARIAVRLQLVGSGSHQTCGSGGFRNGETQ